MKKIHLTPLHDRVVIEETQKEETKTKGGIIIPGGKDDRGTRRGTVVAVGTGKMEEGTRIPLSVKVGDEVVFSWGDEVEIDGTKYLVVKDSEIIGIIK